MLGEMMISNVLQHFSKHNQYWMYLAKKVNPIKADDLLQQAYLKIHKRYSKGEQYEYINHKADRMYMYITLNSINTDYHRWKKPEHQEIIDDVMDGHQDEIDEQINLNQTELNKLKAIKETIDELHWYDQKLYSLHIEKGMSLRKLSRETKISDSSLQQSMKNIKQRIKEKLNQLN
jgi:RNA polymerase sigma factor (sigma-70 family)